MDGSLSNKPSAGSHSEGAMDEARAIFLRNGPVRCPDCGYDVHGCDEPRCPECGWALTLQIKPRMSSVPYWMFSLLINGWLFVWGFGGAFSTWMRVWQYHTGTLRKFPGAANAAAVRGFPQIALPPASGGGSSSGTVIGGGSGAPSLIENAWSFFAAQNLVYQFSMIVFLPSIVVGGIGLLVMPRMKRMSPRASAWMLSASVAVFVVSIVNYVANYLSVLTRMF